MKRSIFAVALICMTASLIGCTKRSDQPLTATSQPVVVQAASGQQKEMHQESGRLATATPRPAPEHFQWRLFLLGDKRIRGGMTKEELERSLFSSERFANAFVALTCTKPYPDIQEIKDAVVCKTSGLVDDGVTRYPVFLSFDMASDHQLHSATEDFPFQLADQARAFLSAEYGEPQRDNTNFWSESGGCSKHHSCPN